MMKLARMALRVGAALLAALCCSPRRRRRAADPIKVGMSWR